jgi:hypothetical protein
VFPEGEKGYSICQEKCPSGWNEVDTDKCERDGDTPTGTDTAVLFRFDHNKIEYAPVIGDASIVAG